MSEPTRIQLTNPGVIAIDQDPLGVQGVLVRDSGGLQVWSKPLAELLGRGGWATAGFVSAFVLDHRWGIGRGFAHYVDGFDLREMETANLGSVQRDGAETLAAAVSWLDERPPPPFCPCSTSTTLTDRHGAPRSGYPGRPYDGGLHRLLVFEVSARPSASAASSTPRWSSSPAIGGVRRPRRDATASVRLDDHVT
jgi:hypothetical protein